MAELLEKKIYEELPMIPLRDTVVFPALVIPLLVSRGKSVKSTEESMERYEHQVVLVVQKNGEIEEPKTAELYSVGAVSNIIKLFKLPDGTVKILVEGISRARIINYTQEDPFFKVRIERIKEETPKILSVEIKALMQNLMRQFERSVELGKAIPPEVLVAMVNIEEPGRLSDFIAFHLNLKTEEKQEILEALDPKERLEKVSLFLNKELEILEISSKIQSQIKKKMDKTQREFFLKEQLREIQKELGELDEQASEIEQLKEKVKQSKMPEDVEAKALKEIERLQRMPPYSAEAPVIRTYLDWLIELPWSIETEEKIDITESARILDEDHYGLKKVKERVLEYLAVLKLTKKIKGPILCFVGPPGTGKTSVGKSIARALGRKFIRVSLGGIRDEAEIRGHRRTYVGALPGRIIQSIHQVKVNNPVFMLDEIDKVGIDFRGDPSAALLEALDPEQNFAFSDHYLEVPFDLSKAMFITTANILDPVPPALKDRMEVIEFPGYTEDEKVQIAKGFLIPKKVEENGLKREQIKFEDSAISEIIRFYTSEAGVRNLERNIAAICRKVAREIADGKNEIFDVTKEMVSKYLGPPQYHYGTAEKKDQIGVATGLAWTAAGGDLLAVEATIMKGKGNLILTGSLGDVMKESAQAAMSYIRTNAKKLSIDEDFWGKYDIHIHVPEGAIPKDGPSAGITMATTLASVLTKRAVSKDIAMTGEITLRGQVLQIGGIKEKVLAAHRAGIKKIILPKDNKKDMEEIPEMVRKDLQFKFVSNIDEVLKTSLKPDKKRPKNKRPFTIMTL